MKKPTDHEKYVLWSDLDQAIRHGRTDDALELAKKLYELAKKRPEHKENEDKK